MKLIYIILAVFSLNTFFVHAETMQKRQYRKRHHKLQINATSLNFTKKFEASGSVDIAYAYNFGYFELGVLFGLSPDNASVFPTKFEFKKLNPTIGFNIEGNFIKNKRRNNWIPSAGLKAIYAYTGKSNIRVSPYLSSKHFVSSRTSINVEIGVPLKVYDWDLGELFQSVRFSVGYAYYFH